MTESVRESAFSKPSGRSCKHKNLLKVSVMESVLESVFSKDSGLY